MPFKRVNISILFEKTKEENLSSKTAWGGVYTFTFQVIGFLISLSSTLILARMLTPDDFGLVAMVVIIINFANILKSAGLSMATIQQTVITEEQVSSLFWINIIFSFSIAIIIVLMAPIAVEFYKRRELLNITFIMAGTFFISGITSQHQAILNRLLRFDIIGLVSIISNLLGLIVAIFLAYLKFSFYAIVLNSLASSIISGLLTFYFFPWKPKLMYKANGLRKMIFFGLDITAFELVNYFSRNADNLLIGKFIGASDLGQYNKAYSIFLMPIQRIRIPVNSVSIPVLSKLKDKPNEFKKYASFILELYAFISFPLAIIFFLKSNFVIDVMLGPGWQAAADVFRILAIIEPLQIISGVRGAVMVSSGFTRRYFYLGLVNGIFTVVSFIIGIKFGIIGIAKAYVLSQLIIFVPVLYFSLRGTHFPLGSFVRVIYRHVIVGLISLTIYYITEQFLPKGHFSDIIEIIIILLTFTLLNLSRKKFRIEINSVINSLRK